MFPRWTAPASVFLLMVAVGCGNDTGGDAAGSSSSGSGSGGTGGSAAGTGGSAGSGTGSGTGGSAGSSSSGGSSGTGSGGSAGSAGASGSGGSAGTAGSGGSGGTGSGDDSMSFFVTSAVSPTGNLGGLVAADATCQELATAVGQGSKTWRAYLSVEVDANNAGMPTHARDRIGDGPWHNANGVLLAENLTALHARSGDAELFLDENGQKINGQWEGSPEENEHDILTGSNPDGTVMPGQTCNDWTSEAMTDTAWVGHSDGLGPGMSSAPPYDSWNSSHENGGCHDTAPKGGAGRFYCFAAD